MRSSLFRAVAVATFVATAIGCAAEAPTAPLPPPPPTAQASLLGGLLGVVGGVLSTVTNLLTSTVTILLTPTKVATVRRSKPLARTVVAKKVIGREGGVFTVPGTGLTVSVAPGAVSVPTTFSATAYAGSAIAYDFAPHQKFAAPIVLTQTFAGTNAASLLSNGQKIEGAYFAKTTDVDWKNAAGTTSEVLSTHIDPSKSSVSIGVLHFSGYMMATGRSDF
jgi:hypothetical protein